MSENQEPTKGVWTPVPPKVRLLILSTFINGVGIGYLIIYVTAFLPEVGFSTFEVGTILGLEGVALLVAGIPFALYSDRAGRKWFVVIGSAIFAPTLIVFGLTRDVWILYIASALGGVGEAMLLSSWNALIADQTDLRTRDSAFSLSFIVGTASFAAGSALPLVFVPLASMTGLTTADVHGDAFLVLGAAGFAAPAYLWLLLRGYQEKFLTQKPEGIRFGGMGQTLRFSFFNSIIGFGAGLIIPLVGAWLWVKFAVPDSVSGPYLALSGLTIAFSAIGSPRLSKKFGLFPAIVLTAGSSTIFMFSLAFIPNVFLVGAVYLVRSGLMNMNSPLMDSFLMGITAPNRRGLASTLNGVIWRIPNTASTIMGGFVLGSATFDLPQLGVSHFDTPWVLATAFYLTGIALLYFSFRHVKPVA